MIAVDRSPFNYETLRKSEKWDQKRVGANLPPR